MEGGEGAGGEEDSAEEEAGRGRLEGVELGATTSIRSACEDLGKDDVEVSPWGPVVEFAEAAGVVEGWAVVSASTTAGGLSVAAGASADNEGGNLDEISSEFPSTVVCLFEAAIFGDSASCG